MTGIPLLLGLGAPAGLWLGLALIPTIVLFLLKRRYRDEPVGSTMLWAMALDDRTVRSPFRRPREWLSLVLLVLGLGALTLALADLRLGAVEGGGRAVVIVVDTSASMGTVEGDGSRLDQALARGADATAAIGAGGRVSVIASSRRPRVICHPTDDLELAVRALAELAVDPVAGDLAAGIELALREAERIGAESGIGPEVIVLSDFAGADLESVDPRGVALTLVACGAERPNAGIVDLSVAGRDDELNHLLVTVAARGSTDLARTVELHRDDALVDVRAITLGPATTLAVPFRVETPPEGVTHAYRVELSPSDALRSDDVARVGITGRPPPRVLLIGDEDPFLARLPQVFPGLVLERVDVADAARARDLVRPFDLAIVTAPTAAGAAPLAARELFVGVVPAGLGITTRGKLVAPVVVDWRRGHPFLRDVGFEDLIVLSAAYLAGPADAEVLVELEGGPELLLLRAAGREVLIWASGMNESNLALLPAFPLLIRNLLAASAGGVEAWAERAGGSLVLRAGLGVIDDLVQLKITAPSGAEQDFATGGRDQVVWRGDLEAGFFRVESRGERDGRTVTRSVGVSLLSPSETRDPATTPRPPRAASAPVSVVSAAAWRTERPVWRSLVLLAAALLLAEIVLWSRRGRA